MADTKLRREDEIDQRANAMFNSHPDLQQMEQDAGKSVGDEAENYAHANDSANPKNSWTGKPTNNSMGNIDAIKDKETTPNWEQNYTGKGANKSTGFSMKNFVKKKGPAGAILALLLGGGVIGTSLLSPALLLVHMKNTFMNDLSDATPAQTIRSDSMMRNKIKGTKVTLGICTNAASIRCKFSTMSNRQVKKFKKAGFTFDGENNSKIPLRTTFDAMTYHPEGGGDPIKISTPQEMKNFARTPEGRAALFKAFNPKTAYFLNGDFSNMLKTKLGLSKESKVKPGDEKEVKSTFDESTGADKAAPAEEGGRYKAPLDDATTTESKVAGKAGGALASAGLGCQIYNDSTRIVRTINTIKLAAAAAFAFTFLTETDKLIAGNANPSVISQLGNQLTSVDNRKEIKNDNGKMVSNPDYGKSPTDSTGYQLAANNTAAPDGTSSDFSLNPIGPIAALAAFIAFPNKLDFGVIKGKTAMKWLCKTAGNGLIGTAALYTACAGLGIPTAGGAFAACVGTQVAIGIALSVLVSTGLGIISSYLISHYGKTLLLDSATFGTAVGNGYFLGAASILSDTAASAGMMPANKSSIKSFFANTDGIRKETTAANVYVAKATPFDVYNQYSFLGSIVQPINATLLSQTTFASKVAGLFNLIPSSFASLGTAGAAYNEAAQPYNDERFSQCNDPELTDIGVNGDEFCNVRYTMSSTELNMDSDKNIQYMVNGEYIDEDTGQARTDTDNGKLYQKFLDNCANRKIPLGSTDQEIQNSDDWNTGKDCGSDPNTNDVSQEQLSNFRVFTMDMQTEDAMDQDPSAGSGSGSTTSTPSGNLPTGSTQDLMKQLLASPNIQFQTPQEKSYAEEIAQTGHATQCGGPAISSLLLSYLVYASQQFKLTIGVFTDGHGCGDGFHDRGIAVDLNGIADANQPFVQSIAGSGTSQGGGSYTDKAESQEIVKFEMYLDAVAQPKNLRFNQSGCVQRNGVTPAQTINAINYNFDSCTHLHMDTWIGGAGVPAGG